MYFEICRIRLLVKTLICEMLPQVQSLEEEVERLESTLQEQQQLNSLQVQADWVHVLTAHSTDPRAVCLKFTLVLKP